MDILPLDWLVLLLAAAAAGLVDAVVGGGGLIQVPVLFGVFPQAAPATLFGTNKLSSVWGTAFAAQRYARQLPLVWSVALPAAAAALIGAAAGAGAVALFPPAMFRKLLPIILLAVAIYVFARKDFGLSHDPMPAGRRRTAWAVAVGLIIGLYDGFFGPGTGSFLIFLFVRLFGFDFLRASAVAKIVNVACNLAALALFAAVGPVFWAVGLLMAIFNMAGSVMGARLALKGGAPLVRRVFLVVVSLLILKTTWDAFLR